MKKRPHRQKTPWQGPLLIQSGLQKGKFTTIFTTITELPAIEFSYFLNYIRLHISCQFRINRKGDGLSGGLLGMGKRQCRKGVSQTFLLMQGQGIINFTTNILGMQPMNQGVTTAGP